MGSSFRHRVHVSNYPRSSFCGQDEVTPFGKNGDKGQRRAAAQCVVMEELVCVRASWSHLVMRREATTHLTTPQFLLDPPSRPQRHDAVSHAENKRAQLQLSRHRVSPELTANYFSTTSCVVTKTADKCRFRPLRKQPSFCSNGCFSQTPRTSVAPPQKARAAAPRPRRTSQTRESSSRNFCPISMLSLCLCCSLAHSFSIGIHTEPDTSDRG